MIFLASDFDNTIYYLDDDEKNKKNVDAIKRFVSAGNQFCIITGRNYTDIKKLLNQYDIPYQFLVCEDGAKLFGKNDECFDTTLLGEELSKKIDDFLKNDKWDYYLDDGYQKTTSYENCVKVVVDCVDEEEKQSIVQMIQSKFKVHIYASRFHVNIINQNVNKKNALEKLIQMQSIDKENVHVIGDNDNDFEMISYYPGAIIKIHHPKLNQLKKTEFETLSDYIDELMKR